LERKLKCKGIKVRYINGGGDRRENIYVATIITKSEVEGQSWSQLTIRTDARSECY
jgi:hypothetical protein